MNKGCVLIPGPQVTLSLGFDGREFYLIIKFGKMIILSLFAFSGNIVW